MGIQSAAVILWGGEFKYFVLLRFSFRQQKHFEEKENFSYWQSNHALLLFNVIKTDNYIAVMFNRRIEISFTVSKQKESKMGVIVLPR